LFKCPIARRLASKFEQSGDMTESHDVGLSKNYYVTNQRLRKQSRKQQQRQRSARSAPQRSITSLPKGGVRISHKEFCIDVNSTTVGSELYDRDQGMVTTARPLILPINPGDSRTFPWLHGMARQYEKYRITDLTLQYMPSCNNFTSGTIAVAPIYDPSEPVPTNKADMLAAQDVVRAPIRRPCVCRVAANALKKTDTMFIRTKHVALEDPKERRLDDLGYFCIMISEVDNPTVNLGELFVSYTVELYNPRTATEMVKSCILKQTEPEQRGSGVHQALFHENHIGDIKHEANTLAVVTQHSDASTNGTTHSSGSDLHMSSVIFQEPFVGLVEILSKHEGTTANTEPTVTANGHNLQEEFNPNDGVWEYSQDALRQRRLARIRPFKTIKNGVNTVSHKLKVIARAGETLALALEGTTALIGHTAEIIMTEMAPVVIDAIIALG